MDDTAIRTLLTRCAFAVLIAAVSAGVLLAITAFTSAKPATDALAQALAGVALLAIGGGLAVVMIALASLFASASSSSSSGNSSADGNIARALDAVTEAILATRNDLSSLRGSIESAPARAPIPPDEAAELAAMDRAASSNADAPQILALLQEIRESSLMTEAQRAQRLAQLREEQKDAAVEHAFQLIAARQWARADQAVAQIQRDHPGVSIDRLRQALTEGRSASAGQTASESASRIEDLMAIGSWDHALTQARQFAADFPDRPDAASLLNRVSHERDKFRESAIQRLYDEVKSAYNDRQYRKAVSAARRLTERFPDHPKATKVAQQLRLLQENAEIEERQELEQKIQEHVKSQRFGTAIELAEELQRRYPDSVQARQLDQVLPKLRELAIQAELG